MIYGAFVVQSADGFFWDGTQWVPNPESAKRFDSGTDPWADCHGAAEELRLSGHACGVAYLPRNVRRPTQVP